METVIKPTTLGGFVRSLSGLFISKENKNGLSPKECTIIAMLLSILLKKEDKNITKEVKEELSNLLNQSIQVTINYINKLKKKGIITKDNELHPLLFKQKVIIEWNE